MHEEVKFTIKKIYFLISIYMKTPQQKHEKQNYKLIGEDYIFNLTNVLWVNCL